MYARNTRNNLDKSRLIELWAKNCFLQDGIILSPIKHGEFGVDNLNTVIQSSLSCDRLSLHYYDFKRGWIQWLTQSNAFLFEGDRIAVTENNYDEDANIRNGDLGVLTKVFRYPDTDGSLGVLEINSVEVKITPKILGKIDLGFAISIHKAQGSQWKNCIAVLPSEAAYITDLTLLYTAVTRPAAKLILVCEIEAVTSATIRGRVSLSRNVGLKSRLLTHNQSFTS